MELGAKIGVKIRERDEGGGNKAKVWGVSNFTVLHIYMCTYQCHMTLHTRLDCVNCHKVLDFGSHEDQRFPIYFEVVHWF